MHLTRNHWWAALALASLATGCAKETTTTVEPASSTVTTPAPSSPEVPATTKTETTETTTAPADAKPAMPADDIKIEAPKVEPATKGEVPKSAGAAAADTPKLSDEEVAEIKKLPADDQILALKQTVCPVSGEPLGSMSVPIKVTAEGKTFFLCCNGCKKEVEKNPKEVVAKLAGK